MATEPTIAVLMANDSDVALRGVKRYRRPSTARLRDFPHWFVVTEAVDLPAVADVVRAANRMRKLRGLLIRLDDDVQFATAMLQRADLHTLAHTLVHSDMTVHRRVIEAWGAGAQDRLIADATLQGETLFVRTCALELLEVNARDVRALRGIPADELGQFEIDVDGSFLHWPARDVHVGVDAIRSITDPEFLEKLRADRLAYDEAFGAAVRKLREGAGLRQADIGGLSTKQVGRIERGEVHPRLDTLRLLAAAHGLDTSAYLDQVAAGCKSAWTER